MKVLFLHGLGMEPGGVKPAFLSKAGLEVVEPALPHGDFTAAVDIAQAALHAHQPDLVVGSSRGGAVAMTVDSHAVPLVLLAPAWKKWGDCSRVKPGTVILHSARDRVVPVEDSRELLRASGLAGNVLHVVGTDHFLTDGAALHTLLEAVQAAGRQEELVESP